MTNGGLVAPQGLDAVEAIWIVDRGRSVGVDSAIDRAPVTTELAGELVDAPIGLFDHSHGETACLIGQSQKRMSDALVDLNPSLALTVSNSTNEATLCPSNRRDWP